MQQEEDERSVFPGAGEREVASTIVGLVVAMVARRVAVVAMRVMVEEARRERREGRGGKERGV